MKCTIYALCALSSAFILNVGGCEVSEPDAGLDEVTLETSTSSAAELRALANEYLFKEVSDAEARAVHDRIRRLSADEADTFHSIVGELSGLAGFERELFDATHDLARSRSVSFLDINEQDQVGLLSDLTGLTREDMASVEDHASGMDLANDQEPSTLCAWPWASCSYTTQWNKTLAGSSCFSGCTSGAGSDRVSNSACELGGCDYRMRFNDSTTSTIDGKTAAADCVVNYYGGLIAYSSGTSTYALSGTQGPSSCGLPTASIHQYFQVR